MLKLNEPLKHNWIIKYAISEQNELVILAEGQVFDFIPNENDFIRIDENVYKVVMRTIDFDNSIIWISLFKNEKTNEK